MDKVLILDFGSQVTQLIARRVREAEVFCEIWPCTSDAQKIKEYSAKAIILSGGPATVTEDWTPRCPEIVFELGIPVLGICYGQQVMVQQLGGSVESSDHREFGKAQLHVESNSLLFEGISLADDHLQVWMSHGDRVAALPSGFSIIGTTGNAPYAAIADEARKFYGLQFHPEVVHTDQGYQLIENFILTIAGCAKDWTMSNFEEEMIAQIRAQVGDGKVLCALSGGVDSSVTAVLLHKAIGDKLTCVFVDTGLLRQGEAEQVVSLFKEHYQINLIHKDAKALFLGRLEGISDPEKKRKIIGTAFIDIFEEIANDISDVEFLAQGTLYPDVIESISFHGGPSVTIKSHHNVGGLPERMNLKLVEPMRTLFKDEVRRLGVDLGLPKAFISRHPFPGPGLAIRLPGEITQEKIEILQKADALYIEEIRKAGLYDEIWQAFAVLLPVKTVGVMGDSRTYEYVCALRAVTSTDGMTADVYPFTHDFLTTVSTRLVNEVKGINRVTYDYTSKPPGTIEWE